MNENIKGAFDDEDEDALDEEDIKIAALEKKLGAVKGKKIKMNDDELDGM